LGANATRSFNDKVLLQARFQSSRTFEQHHRPLKQRKTALLSKPFTALDCNFERCVLLGLSRVFEESAGSLEFSDRHVT
jgi:ABC-type hemin transport system ATPase subunit